MYELPVFTMSHESNLANQAKSNLKRYQRKSPWAEGDPSKTCFLSGIMVPDKIKLDPSPDKDVENAIELHKALNLTPRQASDPALWSRLAHVELWDYMRSRWDVSPRLESSEKKAAGFIRTRYFVMQTNSRTLTRHGLARLWWAAHLTHSDRQYSNTNILIRNPEVAERSYGRSPLILQTLLRFISYKEKSVGKDVDFRKCLRHLLRRFNELGGTCLLVELSQSEIEDFFEKSFRRIISKEKKSGTA